MDLVQLRALGGILVLLGLFVIHKGFRLVMRSHHPDGAVDRQAATAEPGDAAADGGRPAERGEAGDTGSFVFGDRQGGEDAPESGDSGNERGG